MNRMSAIVALDLVGYSRMMAADEQRTIEKFRAVKQEILDIVIEDTGGRVVKTMGDGLLVEFSSALAAVKAGIDIQNRMRRRESGFPSEERMVFRIGINVGEVIVDGNDILGECVNIAARLEALAPPGGICISKAVYDFVGQRAKADFTPLGPTKLKNIPDPVDVWRIEIDGVRVSSVQTRQKRSGLSDRAIDAVLSIAPPIAALVFAVWGIMVMLMSTVMGFGQYRYNLDVEGAVVAKEVGFLWSPGWTVTMVIILPLLISIGLQGMQEMVEIAKRMNKRRMVVDRNFRVVETDYLEERTRRSLRITLRIFAGLIALLSTFAFFEFQSVVGVQFQSDAFRPDTVPMDHRYLERDWSIAALLPPSENYIQPDRALNYTFGLLLHIYQIGFGTAVIWLPFISLVVYAATVFNLVRGQGSPQLVPDLKVKAGKQNADTRLGFEVFEQLSRNAVSALILLAVSLFLISLQNAYIRSPSPHILQFAFPDLRFANGVLQEFFAVEGAGSALGNLSGAISVSLGIVFFATVLLGVLFSFRGAAQHANQNLRDRLEDETEPVPDFLNDDGRESLLGRLGSASFWPVRPIRFSQFVAVISVAAASLLFIRIGVLVALLALAWVANERFKGM